MTERYWTTHDLRSAAKDFEAELVAAGLRPASIATYVDSTATFLRWLEGDYVPRGLVRGRSDQNLGLEIVRDIATFRKRRATGRGVFVITDRPSGRTVVHSVDCPFMTEASFQTKVVDGGSRNGRYLWAATAEAGLRVEAAVRCRHPADGV